MSSFGIVSMSLVIGQRNMVWSPRNLWTIKSTTYSPLSSPFLSLSRGTIGHRICMRGSLLHRRFPPVEWAPLVDLPPQALVQQALLIVLWPQAPVRALPLLPRPGRLRGTARAPSNLDTAAETCSSPSSMRRSSRCPAQQWSGPESQAQLHAQT